MEQVYILSLVSNKSLISNNVQDVLRGRRRRGYDPNDERYYVSDTNTGSLATKGLNHNIDNESNVLWFFTKKYQNIA